MSYKYGLQVTKKYTYICARRGKTCFQKTLLSAPEDVLRFLDLLKLFRSKGDFTFERHPRDARYILPNSVAEFLGGEAGGHFQPRFNGELLGGDGGGSALRIEGKPGCFIRQFNTFFNHYCRPCYARA